METIQDVDNHKDKKKDELRELYNTRNRLYYKRKEIADDVQKDKITKEIIKVTDKIKSTKKELWYCDDIIERTNEIKENLKYLEEEKWKKQKDKSKAKDKKKVK